MIVGLILIGLGIIILLYSSVFLSSNGHPKKMPVVPNPHIAVLIPARNEANVIRGLLESLTKQTVQIDPEDIYLIVESPKDKTIAIAKEYHMQWFVREKLDLKTKGYALMELIEHLAKKEKYYDLYFIFDADNILDSNYIKYMLEDYQKGYAISTGYRALKNIDHYFAISAGLTFSFVNEVKNKSAIKHNQGLILSGTGYYIHGALIKKWQTFPFHSLTEDYESSIYYTLENLSVHYNPKALFYDEQPTNYRTSIIQRTRWINGYFANYFGIFKKAHAKLQENPPNKGAIKAMCLGIIPYLLTLIGLIIVLFSSITNLFDFLLILCGIYFFLVLLTIYFLHFFLKRQKISFKLYLQVLLYHPVFILSYVHAFIRFLIKRKSGWEPIKHGN